MILDIELARKIQDIEFNNEYVSIMVTGSRNFNNKPLVREKFEDVIEQFPLSMHFTLYQGCAPGLDTIAAQVGRELGFYVIDFPPDLQRYGSPKAYWVRNRTMVNLRPRLCLAFPLGESRGTRGTMKLCEEAGIPVINCTEE